MKTKLKTLRTISLFLCTASFLTGCSAVDRIASIGEQPIQSKIESPALKPGYQPISMPMPVQVLEERQANSLWSGGSRKTFFKDQRAKDLGDILTVTINIKDDANFKNETERKRDASEDAGAPNFLGYEKYLGKVFPDKVDPASLLSVSSASDHKGTGDIKRSEDVNLRVAAIVSQILPNGNMVIAGRQEVMVNFENRILQVTGVIRPEDIAIDNTVPYDKIAEARIAYGGKGQMTDVQQPRYGQQLMDIISPF